MNLHNATKMLADYTMGLQPDGREVLVVVVKGTFTIPENPAREPVLAEEQAPLVTTDVFTGEPGFSAPLYEIDYALRKPRCDILLNGSAYAPFGKPVERLTVSLRVGSWMKSFDVVGKRVWLAGALFTGVSNPEPFKVMPISYNNAFGGVDRSQEDPLKHRWFLANHVGVGYHEYMDLQYMDRAPLPNTEETGHPVRRPNHNYSPMAFGPLGRAWQQRVKFAGTYDQNWLDHQCPFWPTDFDDHYYQAAPADQQIDYPRGGEEVELVNLTPGGKTAFKLPILDIPVVFHLMNGEKKETNTVLDTIVVEPDQKRFMLTWRTHLPMRRNIHEMREVSAGKVPVSEGQIIPRSGGKRRFTSLEALVVWKRGAGKR